MTYKKFAFIFAFALLILVSCNVNGPAESSKTYEPRTRTYYIAAENVEWDYAPDAKNFSEEELEEKSWLEQTKYNKTRFIEYTDENFNTKKQQPKWLGILGPTIRGVEGDTIKVVFLNKADKQYSMHPHGLLYDKDNEGAAHEGTGSSMSMSEGKGAKINPGQKFTYSWKVTKESAPSGNEGSRIWMYHSHVAPVDDVYAGLIGPIIITSAGHANEDATPTDVDKEFVNLFMVFDESTDEMEEEEIEGHLKHSINGYIFNNLKGLEMEKGDKVRWHLIGLGTEVDLHTAHWHGEILKTSEKYTDVIELLPASMVSADMIADNIGEWMYHCHVTDHITAGMTTTYKIT